MVGGFNKIKLNWNEKMFKMNKSYSIILLIEWINEWMNTGLYEYKLNNITIKG